MPADAPTVKEVFRSEGLLVRGATGFNSEICFITFDCYTDHFTVDRLGFGERFFQQNGIDAFHVLSRDNEWYQLRELPEACRLISRSAARYRRVVSYGSSMGGYGAVRYGGWAGAQVAFALSPQFSIDARLVPFESRWRREARRTRFIHETGSNAVASAVVVYDPLNVDARHAEMFRGITNVIDIRLPHCGHPSTPYLAELGLLSRSLDALAAGTFDASELQREARRRRKESAQFHVNLALRTRCSRRKADLGKRAIQLSPHSAETRAHYAVFAAGAGWRDEALTAIDMAEALEPGRVHMQLQRSRVYELLDDVDRAVDVMRSLTKRVPDAREYRVRLRNLRGKQLISGLRRRLAWIG